MLAGFRSLELGWARCCWNARKSWRKTLPESCSSLDSGEPTPEEVRDALAEITNITAGNFKSLVGGHCHLSMPQVTDRVHDQPAAPKDAVISRQAFDCQGELFVVTILEGQANSRSS